MGLNIVSIVDSTKLPLAGGTMTGTIDMGNQAITNVDSLAFDLTNDYLFAENSLAHLGLTTTTAGQQLRFGLHTADGDATDACTLDIHGYGPIDGADSLADKHRLIIGWFGTDYVIRTNWSDSAATTREQNLVLSTENAAGADNANQLRLPHTGGVTMSGTLTVPDMSLSGGNISNLGLLTGDDLDITAGTGDYSSTGTVTSTALVVDTTTLVVDSVNHRVGMGTASPTEDLEVRGNIYARISGGEGADGIKLSVDGANSYINSIANFLNIRTSRASDDIIFIANTIEVMRIDAANSNIGINTTAPDVPLEINHATAPAIRLTYNDADGSATNYSQFQTGSDGDLTITTVDSDGAAGDIKLRPDGKFTVGDGTNETAISATGDMSFAGSAGFYPRFLTQAGEPAAGTGATQLDTSEMCIWKDSDDNKIYFCFNDGGTIKTAEAA